MRSGSAGLPDAVEVGVEELEDEVLAATRKASDALESLLEPGGRSAARGLGDVVDEPCGGDAKDVGGASDEVEARIGGATLVVVDHPARGVEQLGEPGLREAAFLAECGEAAAEGRSVR